jgi:DNA-binding Lrp family transcriptional regulator
MTASIKARKRISEKLPHELLKRLYLNSRTPIKEIEREVGISHHTLSKYLKEAETKYKLKYTLDLDTALLGLSEARIFAVKFERVPDIDILRGVLEKDPFVQNAYLASGDFDLILHVIGLNHTEYNYWSYRFRLSFCRYKPRVKVATLDNMLEGFMPIRTKLISMGKGLSDVEKKILIKLVENSRIKIKDLAESAKIPQMKAIYTINRLKGRGIIKRFTTCIQNPDKRIFLFYAVSLMPNEEHHPKLLLNFLNRIIGEEQPQQSTTDYSVECETSGHFDAIFFCNFKDGLDLNNKGPNFLKKAWESEFPIVDQCVLTEVITGSWPFNTNCYMKWATEKAKEEEKPIPIKIY